MPIQHVLVVDDDPLSREFLVEAVAALGLRASQAADVENGHRLALEDCPDLVLTDLRMPGPDGIALTEAIKARQPDLPVVIVSAHDDGELRAFDARALDYLLKPVRLERLKATLERVRETATPAPDKGSDKEPLTRLAVRRRGAYVVVDIDEVVFFETKDELVWAVTPTDRFALDLTLAKLEEQLGEERFFRSHRGALVRLDRICAIEPKSPGIYELVMEHPDEPRVSLSRDRAKQLRERIPFAG